MRNPFHNIYRLNEYLYNKEEDIGQIFSVDYVKQHSFTALRMTASSNVGIINRNDSNLQACSRWCVWPYDLDHVTSIR